MTLPELTNLDTVGKRVLLRADLDVDNPTDQDQRLVAVAETIKALLSRKGKVIIAGHRGRPEGKVNNEYSLKPVCDVLSRIVGTEIKFVYDLVGVEAMNEASSLAAGKALMLENLRFDTREEENDEGFAKSMAGLAEVYVNEAFGVSHREHASIVGVPKFLPGAIGLRFVKEIWNLSKIIENPARPLVFVISGLKEDKLKYVNNFESFADKILLGGRLPEYLGDKALESVRIQSGKVITGNLVMDKEDITLNTVQVFEKEIEKAGTIVVSGPLGKFEDEGHRQGTAKIYEAVARSDAFKVAGGGDTEAALSLLKLGDKFDWVSVGGGAMLEYLSQKTLPGLEVLLS